MLPYVLIQDAEADLMGIARYTLAQWGETQAKRYSNKLEAGFRDLAVGKKTFRSFSEKYPNLRVAKCQHHYVFFLLKEKIPHILAVLHERMDLVNRLEDRLNG